MDTAFHLLTPLSTISFSQYRALALVQPSDCFAPRDTPSSLSWRTGANGHLKSLYGQEASVQQKQNISCWRHLDKILGTFLWCFAQTSSTIILSWLLSNWLVNWYIMWVLPWKSCPFCKQGCIVSLFQFPWAAGVRPRHPRDTGVLGSHSSLHPVPLVVGLRNVFTLGLFTIPCNWVLSYRAPQDWGLSRVGRAMQQHWKAQS